MTSANGRGSATAPRGHWIPLLVYGGLAALSLPLSVLGSPPLTTGTQPLVRDVYPMVTQAMYLGGGFSSPPFPFPLGWYWVGALAAGVLLTAASSRWQRRRAGRRIPLRGYLATGLALAAADAALPMLAWGTPIQIGPGAGMWTWIDATWRQGTFALAATAVLIGILARLARSRALAAITAVYALAVCFTGWLELHQVMVLPAFYPFGDPAAMLPTAVLLLAGLGAAMAAGIRRFRSRGEAAAQPAGASAVQGA